MATLREGEGKREQRSAGVSAGWRGQRIPGDDSLAADAVHRAGRKGLSAVTRCEDRTVTSPSTLTTAPGIETRQPTNVSDSLGPCKLTLRGPYENTLSDFSNSLLPSSNHLSGRYAIGSPHTLSR